MSRPQKHITRAKSKNKTWQLLIIGLLFGGGLIALSVFTALSQATKDAKTAGDVNIGIPLQVAAVAFIGAGGFTLWGWITGFI
ncbi:MAG: hypothetical protein M1482_17050 [Chloroflexi bacterium]|nr:hypothetical protein [Chloroflexota bacterium]